MHIIKNGNKSLAVDAALSFTVKSPIFTPREGSFVFNFTVPIPGNEAFFQGAHRIEQKSRIKKLSNIGLFSQSGEYICIGDIIFQEATKKTMKCMIAIANGSLNSEIQDTLISEITDIERDRTNVDEVIDDVFPTYDFAMFPVKNPVIFEDMSRTEEFQNTYNTYSTVGWSFLSVPYITPFPYVGWLIEQIYKYAGFTIEYNCFRADTELRKWCIYHNTLLRISTGSTFSLTSAFPGYSIMDLLAAIEDFFNVKGHISMSRKSVLIKKTDDVLNSDKVTDLTDKLVTDHTLTIDYEGNGYILTMKTPSDTYWEEHVKDITGGGYNILDPVQTVDDLPDEEYEGYTSKDIILVIDDDKYYASQMQVDQSTGEVYLTWSYFSDNIIPLMDGDQDVELETAATLLTSVYDLGIAGLGTALTPITGVTGNAEHVIGGAERHQADIRFLAYIGMQPSTVIDIPTGSSDVYNKNDDVVSGLAARWDGEYGRYEKLFKKTVYFWQTNEPMKFVFLLTEREAKTLATDEKYAVGNMNYIIEELAYSSNGTGYVKVTATMRSVL